MEICVLGSGSAGNATILRLGERLVMIDAGFGPRTTAKRLTGTGAQVSALRALLLTHLDSDHFNPNWLPTLHARGITLHCHERHLYELHHCQTVGGITPSVLHRAGLLRTFHDQPFTLEIGGTAVAQVQPIPLAHDTNGSVAYRIECDSGDLAYATDLGHVTDALLEAMIDADLIAIESNYDPPMQLDSNRPWMLKQRIMGGSGHLSNAQALDALKRVMARCRRLPRHIVLLHLSRQCNDPLLVRRLFHSHAPLVSRLCITCQHEPTPWLSATQHQTPPGEQFTMFA